jgi:hypothetical protein
MAMALAVRYGWIDHSTFGGNMGWSQPSGARKLAPFWNFMAPDADKLRPNTPATACSGTARMLRTALSTSRNMRATQSSCPGTVYQGVGWAFRKKKGRSVGRGISTSPGGTRKMSWPRPQNWDVK